MKTKMEKELMRVLIESDWNLKPVELGNEFGWDIGINRIRLEFKVICEFV